MREQQTCGKTACYQEKWKRSPMRESSRRRHLGCAGEFHVSVREMNLSYLASRATHQPRLTGSQNIGVQSEFQKSDHVRLCDTRSGHTE